ncbi:hypothetical protein [Deinococcus fonticola]|uniref:hypothetical protein n=1 Tax=Deinococcus fonticola TaxID=2528713 RepID=UPI001074FC97|nr:hypothetical protein [Deinococcus fonticola]
MEGWLGAVILMCSGLGWGRQVSAQGVTLPPLLLSIVASGLGLGLCIQAAARGHDLPLALGATGALGLATLMALKPGRD